MGLVAILDPGLRLAVEGGNVVVERGGARVHTLRLPDIDELLVHGTVEMTGAARRKLLRAGVDVVFLGSDGRYEGRLVAEESRAGDRRLAQYRAATTEGVAVRLAAPLVAAKLANQRQVLVLRQRRVRSERVAEACALLRSLGRRAEVADSLDTLRGLEGAGAARYFGVFPDLIAHPSFAFTGRNRRPPKDPINALLSYLYGALVARVDGAVRRVGLDPYVGFLHGTARRSPSLTLDLAEPFRPIVDGAVLTLVNRRQLVPEDFRHPGFEDLGADEGFSEDAVWLAKSGRAVASAAWGELQRSTLRHPVTGDRHTLVDLIDLLAAAVARAVDKDEPIPIWKLEGA